MDKSYIQQVSSKKLSNITRTNNYKRVFNKAELGPFVGGSMIGFSLHMRDAHVCRHLQSRERSISSASVKIGLVAVDFEPADAFDGEPISLLEPFGLFCYLSLYNLLV